MLFSTIGQVYVFLWMVGAGMLTGALYSLCAGLRRLLCAEFWLTLFIDLLFGLGSGLILTAALVAANYGRLRLYALLGGALGLALFRLGAEPLIKRCAKCVSDAFRLIFVHIGHFRLIKVIFK